MNKLYLASKLNDAEFECLLAVSVDEFITDDALRTEYMSVSELPQDKVTAAIETLKALKYVSQFKNVYTLTPLGKKVIEFDESTSQTIIGEIIN